MDVEKYDKLRDLLNAFTDLSITYGYNNFSDVLNDMKSFELYAPRRMCSSCHCHIYDRYYDACNKCGKNFHKECFDSHLCY